MSDHWPGTETRPRVHRSHTSFAPALPAHAKPHEIATCCSIHMLRGPEQLPGRALPCHRRHMKHLDRMQLATARCESRQGAITMAQASCEWGTLATVMIGRVCSWAVSSSSAGPLMSADRAQLAVQLAGTLRPSFPYHSQIGHEDDCAAAAPGPGCCLCPGPDCQQEEPGRGHPGQHAAFRTAEVCCAGAQERTPIRPRMQFKPPPHPSAVCMHVCAQFAAALLQLESGMLVCPHLFSCFSF